MVSTPSLSRLWSQAIDTYSASPRKPNPSGSLTPPNLVAMKMSWRFSGVKASHLPIITSASPYQWCYLSGIASYPMVLCEMVRLVGDLT